MVESNAALETLGRRLVCGGGERCGVILEPRQSPSAVHPESSQEPQLPNRRSDIGRQSRTGGEHEEHGTGGRVHTGGHEDHRSNVAASKDGPRRDVPRHRSPPGCGDRAMSGFPCRPPVAHETFADTGDADFLRGRRGGRRGEEMPRESVERSRALLSRAFDARSPGGREHRRQREEGEEGECRMHGDEEHDRDTEAEDPPRHREHRHVHVIQHEHLIAQHRNPIEILGNLLVGDARDARLQPRHVRLERDGDLVTKAALDAGAHRAQEPGAGRRQAERDRRKAQSCRVGGDDSVRHQLEPEREQSVRKGSEERKKERPQHQARLVPEAQPAESPHR